MHDGLKGINNVLTENENENKKEKENENENVG